MLADAAPSLGEMAYLPAQEMTRLHRLARSPSMATWASFLARALSIFALAPLMLATLTPLEAALWFLLITLQGMQLLFETSIGAGFIRAIGYALGGARQVRDLRQVEAGDCSPNMALFSAVWGTMGLTYLGVAAATGLLIGGLALWSAPALLAQGGLGQAGTLAVLIFVAGAVMRAYIGRHISFLFAAGRIPLLRWTEAGYWSLAFLCTVLALWSGAGLLGVVLAYQVPLALGLVWTVHITRRDQADRPGFDANKGFDSDILAQLWPAFWRSGLGVGAFLLVTQGAGLYYARIGEPADVAAYLFAMSLMRPMMQFAQVPFFTKLPRLAELQASGARAEQIQIAQQAMRLSLWLLALMVLGIAAALWGMQAFDLSETQVPALLWAVIGLAACAERVGAMHLQLYSTTNHILWHWANGGTSVLFVGLAMLSFEQLGVLAFPMAHLLATAVFYVPFSMIWSYRAFGLPWPGFELRVSVIPLALLLGYTGAVLWGSLG